VLLGNSSCASLSYNILSIISIPKFKLIDAQVPLCIIVLFFDLLLILLLPILAIPHTISLLAILLFLVRDFTKTHILKLNPLYSRQPPLNLLNLLDLAPSRVLLTTPIPRNASKETADALANTTKRTSNTANNITLSELAYALSQAAGDAADGVIGAFAHIAHNTANGAANCASEAGKPVADEGACAFSYTGDCIACVRS
jgi:hypothetical protein